EHLNDSLHAVEDHIIEAIRKLGVNCMGIDPEATRREALDELAMALESLKTGEELVTSEAVAAAKKGAMEPFDPESKEAIEELIAALQRCGFSPEIQQEVVRVVCWSLDGTWVPEAQVPTDPSKSEGESQTADKPYTTFATETELNDFVAGIVGKVNQRAH